MTEPWMWQAYPRLMMVGLSCWLVGILALITILPVRALRRMPR